MPDIYKLLIDLVGRNESDPHLQTVQDAIGETPIVQKHGGRYGTNISFAKTGAEIWIRKGKFHSVGFSSHFAYELVNGVTFKDNWDDAVMKLNVAPTKYDQTAFVIDQLNHWFCSTFERTIKTLRVTQDRIIHYSTDGLSKDVPMIPCGYMAKFVNAKPDWLEKPGITDSYAVKDHVSENFVDWNHLSNIHSFYDSPEVIEEAAKEENVSLAGSKLFYYEEYPFEYCETENTWDDFVSGEENRLSPHTLLPEVSIPKNAILEGFDLNPYQYNPECSALVCSGLASEVNTNSHCLIPTFEEAKLFLETYSPEKNYDQRLGEKGPYRIYAVYSVLPWIYEFMER